MSWNAVQRLLLVVRYAGRRLVIIVRYHRASQVAPSVGRHNSMRVDDGKQGWNLLATKMKARTVAGREREEPAM